MEEAKELLGLPHGAAWGAVLGPEGSREGAAPLPDVALDAALAPDLVLYQVGVVGGGDEVVAERLAHVLPQHPVPGVEDGALRGAEVHEEPVSTQHMASPGCRWRERLSNSRGPGGDRIGTNGAAGGSCHRFRQKLGCRERYPRAVTLGRWAADPKARACTPWLVSLLHQKGPGIDKEKGNCTQTTPPPVPACSRRGLGVPPPWGWGSQPSSSLHLPSIQSTANVRAGSHLSPTVRTCR